jgi:hypothetical protein
MEEKQIILNQIRTPDGTILKSMHRHDYVTYTDNNGHQYMVDGGSEYLRRNVNETKKNFLLKIWIFLLKLIGKKWNDPLLYTELSVYSDAPFEVIRENFHRGGRGKDGRQPLTWVPMHQMSNEWIKACIRYNAERGMTDCFANKLYAQELEYRATNEIVIPD